MRALDPAGLVAALRRNAYDFETLTPAGVDVLLATDEGVVTVARQEFLLRIRAGRCKALLAAFFVVLVCFTALLRSALHDLPTAELPFQGTVLFGGLMLFVLGLALLVVPALAASR